MPRRDATRKVRWMKWLRMVQVGFRLRAGAGAGMRGHEGILLHARAQNGSGRPSPCMRAADKSSFFLSLRMMFSEILNSTASLLMHHWKVSC